MTNAPDADLDLPEPPDHETSPESEDRAKRMNGLEGLPQAWLPLSQTDRAQLLQSQGLPQDEDDLGDISLIASRRAPQRPDPEWGRRWPDCDSKQQNRATGGGVSVNIHKELAVLTAGLLDRTVDVHRYILNPKTTGGFACRPVGGTNSPSNHSIAVAIDLNWDQNGFSANPKFTIPMTVVDEWERWGWEWGGRWRGKKDTMHMEFTHPIAEARRLTKLFLEFVNPAIPARKVHLPRHNPPWVFQPIVDEVVVTRDNGEVWFYQLGLDGSIYNHLSAPFVRGVNGEPFFLPRRASTLEVVPGDPLNGDEFLRITADTGETYHRGTRST